MTMMMEREHNAASRRSPFIIIFFFFFFFFDDHLQAAILRPTTRRPFLKNSKANGIQVFVFFSFPDDARQKEFV